MIIRRLLTCRTYPRLPLLEGVHSKRSITSTSQYPRPEGNHYRLWSLPGDSVLRKEILARQWKLIWHPGLNTGIDENRSIYALCDGIMVISEEKFDPDWNNKLVQKVYQIDGNKRAPDYFRYIHVIPKLRVSEFKLVDLI